MLLTKMELSHFLSVKRTCASIFRIPYLLAQCIFALNYIFHRRDLNAFHIRNKAAAVDVFFFLCVFAREGTQARMCMCFAVFYAATCQLLRKVPGRCLTVLLHTQRTFFHLASERSIAASIE